MTKKIKGVPAFTNDGFFSEAREMRQEFLARFEDQGSNKRFVWDYWHVPGQYTLLRTPAYHFFSPKLYKRFHEALLAYGRETLGCYDVTPPWLSYYIDGCKQDLHADVPHGPWAFVFSLTDWAKREFTGGETLLLKETTLDYWRHFSEFEGVERDDLVTEIEAKFNRLLIFDPRVPHGVNQVRGIQAPQKARLVVHGWFTTPEPYVVGALTRKQATGPLNEMIVALSNEFNEHSHLHGSLSVRFHVERSGQVSNQQIMTNTLISRDGLTSGPFLKAVRRAIEATRFPRARAGTDVTLPLVFR